MKTIILFAFFLAVMNSLIAQSPPDSLILTKAQNDHWIEELKLASKDKQLELIKKRLLADTNVYVGNTPDPSLLDKDAKPKAPKVEAYGRPLFVFNQGYVTSVTNRTDPKSIVMLVGLLADDQIGKIYVITGESAATLYGTRARSGVILISTKSRNVLRQIKKITL